MNDILDIDKDVAEKLMVRIMTPFRKAMAENKPTDGESWEDDKEIIFTLAQIRELDKDLGAIGLTLANRYREQSEFRTTLSVVANENVRLLGSVSALSELLEAEKKQSESLANALTKSETVNDKLTEVTRSGFKAN